MLEVGERRHGRGACGSGVVWHASWKSGPARSGAGRAGVAAICCARKVFDRVSAGRTPAIAGKREGPGAWAWHGELRGVQGKLLDKVGCCFAAGLGQVGMVVACHAIASYARFLGHGVARVVSSRCVGFRVSWGTRREGKGSKGARLSTLVVFASFRSLLGIKFPYFGRDRKSVV